jgi:spoIIIJ-associated protein
VEKSAVKTGKTLEEAIEAALAELGAERDETDYEIIEEKEKKGIFGLFGSRQVTVRVFVRQLSPLEKAKEFLARIFQEMSLDVMVEKFSTGDDSVTLQLHGADLGILIGKHGQTLDSLQDLTNLVANKDQEKWLKFSLDVEDYRKRRIETLNRLALRLAEKAKRRNERIVLEPMNSHERKIIHMALQDDRRISTYSEGDDPFRHVVITVRKY